jgi:hypothetical protein
MIAAYAARRKAMPNRTVATLGDIPAIKELSMSLPKVSLEEEHRPQRAARKNGEAAVNTLASMVGSLVEGLGQVGQDTANVPAAAAVKPDRAPRRCSVCKGRGHNKRSCASALVEARQVQVVATPGAIDDAWEGVKALIRPLTANGQRSVVDKIKDGEITVLVSFLGESQGTRLLLPLLEEFLRGKKVIK